MSLKNKKKLRGNQSPRRANAYLKVIDRKTVTAHDFVKMLEESPYIVHREEAVKLREELNQMSSSVIAELKRKEESQNFAKSLEI